ncbi:spaetzle-processing enzyme-like [Bacillus rossius redtenbacheri]|uniref:spaetzle-processing enzyme-like n=1 Tax=Bacillus rossius redtenbacheri TaxID=93214 RepID=UPI002FDDD187
MNMSFIGEHPHVAGWGIYDLDKLKQSAVLLTVQLPVVENSQCAEAFRRQANVDDTQMCAGGSVGQDTCGGDSGGPLMLPDDSLGGPPRYFLIGIVSFGASRCGATSKPGVYTRASAFMRWIMDNMHP